MSNIDQPNTVDQQTGASQTPPARKTYQVWTGDYWTFEQIVENLQRLVRSVVAKTTPEECIDDCMQDAWLRLYERLQADPQALGPDPNAITPHHAMNYYVNRIVWDAHKGTGFNKKTRTYREHSIPASVIGADPDLDDLYGLDAILFADEHHTNWVEESDIVIDLEWAVEKYLTGIKLKHLPHFAMAVLCLLYRDITYAQGAVIVGCSADTVFLDSRDARLVLQVFLRDYQDQPKRFYPRKSLRPQTA